MQYHTAHHTFPAVPFHRLPELHAELERCLGYSPPTVGYVEFQRRFIAALARGPEPVEGVSEVGSAHRLRMTAIPADTVRERATMSRRGLAPVRT